MRRRIHSWTNVLVVGPALVMSLAMGCAATGSLTRGDVLRQYDAVAELNSGVDEARFRQSDLLASEQFQKTKDSLETAVKYARNAEKDKANKTAARGLEELNALNQMVTANRRVMEEVMTTRSRAQEQGASNLFATDFGKADMAFRKATRFLEQNRLREAEDLRPELIRVYADLELRALKEGLAAAAVESVSLARLAGADDYAPKTLEMAVQELKLATSVLDADRTRVDKSNAHASKAMWLARRAQEIAATAKWFDDQEFTDEDLVLWHQRQLQQIRQPATSKILPFDRSNAEVVATLRDDVASLVKSTQDLHKATKLSQAHIQDLEKQMTAQAFSRRQELATILRDHETQLTAIRSGSQSQIQQANTAAAQQVAELQKKLSSETAELEASVQRERQAEARYEEIRKMFGPEEADVLRQGANVMIRLKGFQFSSGESRIESENFSLLNKVLWALNIFPQGKVTVSGHTDSSGSPQDNLALSSKRAISVVDFLTTVGGYSAAQLTSEGRGEQEPIATNETSEGRATNRRIDVWIAN